MLGRPCRCRVRVQRDQRAGEVAVVCVHDHVAHQSADRLELALDRRRGDVLATRGLHEVLLAVGDLHPAHVVDLADITGGEPTALGERLGVHVRQVPVAAHDARPTDQDFPVAGDLDLGPRGGFTHRAELDPVGTHDAGGRAGLGETVTLEDLQASGIEPQRDVLVEGCRAGDHVAHPAAEPLTDLREDQLVGDVALHGQRAADLLTVQFLLSSFDPDLEGPGEDLGLRSALGQCGLGDPGVDLLVDPRDRRHERRLDDSEVVHDVRHAAVHRGDEPDLQLQRKQYLAEAVCQRQPEELHVVDADDVQALDEGALVGPVAVRQFHALGLAGRSRGVDQRREVVPLHRRCPLLHGVRVVLQVRLTQRPQVVEGDHPVAIARTVEVDDLLDGELVLVHAYLLDLRVVLGEDEAGVGVAEDVGDVGVVGGRVDRRGGAAGQHDAVVGQDPVQTGARSDGDALFGLQPQRQQSGGDLLRVVVGLLPGQ